MRTAEADYVPQLFLALSNCLQEAHRLPVAEDFEFFSGFSDFSSTISSQMAEVMRNLTATASLLSLDISDFSDVQRASEMCLAQVETSLSSLNTLSALPPALELRSDKPQKHMKHLFDNSEYGFISGIKKKYHAKTSLSNKLIAFQEFRLGDGDSHINAQTELDHPYKFELENLQYTSAPLTIVSQPSSRVFELVEDKTSLALCINELKKCSEIGLAIKSHNQHSYFGITVLVALSTHDKDYLVDTLKVSPWFYKLGKVLADPNITKVMHDAAGDLLALQRDFGLYVVNLFDTCIASAELGYPCLTLPFLVKSFCDAEMGKEQVGFDWRLRPITEEMGQTCCVYARSLPFIYNKLREEFVLKNSSSLVQVFDLSKDLCLATYKKYRPYEPLNFALEDQMKTAKLQKLEKFRDFVARMEDEHPESMLSSSSMLSMVCYEPKTKEQLLAIDSNECVSKHVPHLLNILKGKESTIALPISEKDLFAIGGWTAKHPNDLGDYFETKECFGPEVFDGVCQTNEEKAAGLVILGKIQKMGRPPYITNVPIEEPQMLRRTRTLTELDFANFDKVLEQVSVNENVIPSSVKEIFDISNANRKKNKKIKVGNESNAKPSSSTKKISSFMTEIGWEKPAFRSLFK